MRRVLAALVTVGVFAGLSLVGGPATAKKPDAQYKLGVGDELFWDGEEIELAQVPHLPEAQHPDLCGVTAECYEYEVDVAQGEPGARLRVALSAQLLQQEEAYRTFADLIVVPSFENVFRLQLFAPETDPGSGEPVAERVTFEGITTSYAIEVFKGGNNPDGTPMDAPVAGTWTIRVIPESVVDMAFRMRAKLEPPAPDPEGILLPNLRITPPFELGFPLATEQVGPGIQSVPQSRSCMAGEVTEPAEVDILKGDPPDPKDVPTLCLRYSMGVENAGDGVFRLQRVLSGFGEHPDNFVEEQAGVAETHLNQLVCTFDNKLKSCIDVTDLTNRPTGTFHQRHTHYHWQGAFFSQLFALPDDWGRGDPQPMLTAAGEGRKLGMATTPEVMADWNRFYHRPRAVRSDDGDPGNVDNRGCFLGGSDFLDPSSQIDGGPCDEDFLQAGWGDVYEWNRNGNYVDFPKSGPTRMPKEGFYILRGTTDILGQIVESNETDNTSYAFFEVDKNGRVELIERGYGTDPWDPHKVVLTVAP